MISRVMRWSSLALLLQTCITLYGVLPDARAHRATYRATLSAENAVVFDDACRQTDGKVSLTAEQTRVFDQYRRWLEEQADPLPSPLGAPLADPVSAPYSMGSDVSMIRVRRARGRPVAIRSILGKRGRSPSVDSVSVSGDDDRSLPRRASAAASAAADLRASRALLPDPAPSSDGGAGLLLDLAPVASAATASAAGAPRDPLSLVPDPAPSVGTATPVIIPAAASSASPSALPPARPAMAPSPADVSRRHDEAVAPIEMSYQACGEYIEQLALAWCEFFNDQSRKRFSGDAPPPAQRRRLAPPGIRDISGAVLLGSVPAAAAVFAFTPAGPWSLALLFFAYIFHASTTVVPPVVRGLGSVSSQVCSGVGSELSRIGSLFSRHRPETAPSIVAFTQLIAFAPVASDEVQAILKQDVRQSIEHLAEVPGGGGERFLTMITSESNRVCIRTKILPCIQKLLRHHTGREVSLKTIAAWINEIMAHLRSV